MEFNSHIYESMQHVDLTKEADNLLMVLDQLGNPEEVLKPLVADKKMAQATRTFNPIHIAQALILNISNGIAYLIFSILYLLLFSGILLVVAKIFIPEVGLYYKKDKYLIFGTADNIDTLEILGDWFFPVMLSAIIAFYFIITLVLKFKRNINNKKQ